MTVVPVSGCCAAAAGGAGALGTGLSSEDLRAAAGLGDQWQPFCRA